MEILQVLVTLASIVSIILSLLALQQARLARTSSVYTEISQQANCINDTIIRHEMLTPYMVLLNMSLKDDKDFAPLSVVFFHQLNLLSIVYRNRHFLGQKNTQTYLAWNKTVVRPWIKADKRLERLWQKVIESKDIYGEDFITWLEAEPKH